MAESSGAMLPAFPANDICEDCRMMAVTFVCTKLNKKLLCCNCRGCKTKKCDVCRANAGEWCFRCGVKNTKKSVRCTRLAQWVLEGNSDRICCSCYRRQARDDYSIPRPLKTCKECNERLYQMAKRIKKLPNYCCCCCQSRCRWGPCWPPVRRVVRSAG